MRSPLSPAAAAALGGKMLLALGGALLGFALVASGGLLGICLVVLVYALGISGIAALEPRRPVRGPGPLEGLLSTRGRSLPLPAGVRYGSYLRLARRAVLQIEQVVRSGPLAARATLAELPRRAGELELRIRDLARAGESIRRYLAPHSRLEGDARERSLRLRLRSTQDPVARAHFEQALRALTEEHAIYDRMRAALDRVEAQIAHAAYTLSCTQSKVTALAAGPDVGGVTGAMLARDLDALTRELATFDDALNEVLGWGDNRC